MKLFLLNETPTETQRLSPASGLVLSFFRLPPDFRGKGRCSFMPDFLANKFKPKNQPTMETAPLLSLNHDQSL